ncbi:hypothetical protein ES707_03169 [subsurface metagenome]
MRHIVDGGVKALLSQRCCRVNWTTLRNKTMTIVTRRESLVRHEYNSVPKTPSILIKLYTDPRRLAPS